MCYSAQIWADYRRYKRAYGSEIDIATFAELFWSRLSDPAISIPKGVEASFDHPTNPDEQRIKGLIDQHRAAQAMVIEQDLFKQKGRLAEAERKLASKVTKAASESKRIATDKIARGHNRLKDLNRFELQPRDSRIFPGHYAPVMIMEDGRKMIRLMRYQCRPAGKPAFYDEKYPGTYNARKTSLSGFWRGQFGYTHGLMMVDVFYENVDRPSGNVVLEFHPEPAQPMLVACLWSKWTAPGQPDLLSFAAITDDPPPEVEAAGHDRCIVSIKSENVDRWLQPNPERLDEQMAILEDPVRPYYEHRLAA
ncbi:SOS response-associated peptidase family protein [Hydrogenophaga sp. UC242_50]|uniref:SOS response-associated peptidase family protein n=1 Tax=unclassified Hydrogenophaga TaxID=2610897 RepID=UPI0036D40934